MLTFIGVILILVSIIMFVLNPIVSSFVEKELERKEEAEKRDSYYEPKESIFLLMENLISKKKAILSLVIGVVLSIISGAFFYADPGTAYAVQYPWGGQSAVFHQGIHSKLWGRLIPIQFEMPIKYVIPSVDAEGKSFIDKEKYSKYAITDVAKQWEFNDAVKGRIATSVVIAINTSDADQFLLVADINKSEKNLVRSRIIPNIDQSIKNTSKLMSAQDYISGKSADFDRYFHDQLEHGMYILEEYTTSGDAEIIGDSTTVRKVIGDKNNRQKRFRIKYDSSGEPIRVKGNSLNSYGLTVVQAVVTEVDWEPTFDKRLQLQKEEVAQTQLEKQQAEREFYRAQKERAKGEADKATERARLEKEQIQQTIAAETEAKVATFNLVKEKKQFEVEKFKAKSKKVAADAQYYENAKLVSAGLTPQERAEWHYKEVDVVSKNFATMSTPTFMMTGGSKGGNPTEQLIQAAMAKQLIGDIKPIKSE